MKPSTAIERPLLFVDTWGWIVLADARDPRHDEVVALRRRHTESGILVTTDYVLDETFTRLYGGSPFAEAERFCAAVLRARDTGIVRVEPITTERFARAYRLRVRYRDKPRISFTDLTSFVVMTELGIRDALTADAHFRTVQWGFRTAPWPQEQRHANHLHSPGRTPASRGSSESHSFPIGALAVLHPLAAGRSFAE
jgi:predicted nucleic acid-binding protein